MAFLSKVGNILRQTAGKQLSNEISASRPSLLRAVRLMSSSKVFVGGISYQTDDTTLKQEFAKYGEVVEARVIMDRETGRSRGFAFVTYTTGEEASSAIQALDGQDLHGRRIRVNYANERPRNFGGGFGGGGGGGYGGGDYGGGGYGGGGYGGGGSGAGYNDSYGGGNTGGAGGYPGKNVSYGQGNTFDSNSTGGYGVAGGGGSESFGDSNVGGGFDANTGLGQGSGDDQFGQSEINSMGSDQERDEDDFAKRA